MSAPRVDLTGETFGRWTVLKIARNVAAGKTAWWCRCACGTERAVRTGHLTGGVSLSCGCLLRVRLDEQRRRSDQHLTKPNSRAAAERDHDSKVARAIIEPPLTIADIGAFPPAAFPELAAARVSDLDVVGGQMTAGDERRLLFTYDGWHRSQLGTSRRVCRPVTEDDDTSRARCDGDPFKLTW